MEKYTVDIDKVLDDFEETEALKIDNSHKNTATSLFPASVLKNYNEENKYHINEAEVAFENTLKIENDANSNKNISLCSDSDTLSQNVIDKSTKYLEMPDGCDDKINSFSESISKSNYPADDDYGSNIFSSAAASEVNQGINGKQVSFQAKFVECDYLNNVKSAVESSSESHLIINNTMLLPQNSICNSTKFDTLSHDLHLSGNESKENFQEELKAIKWNSSNTQFEPQKNIDLNRLSTDVVSTLVVDSNEKDTQSLQVNIPEYKADVDSPSSIAVGGSDDISKAEDASMLNEHNLIADSLNFVNEVRESVECNQRELLEAVPVADRFYPEAGPLSETDEDSGVSSEDGNNSPLFFVNNQIVDNIDVEENQEACAANSFDGSTCDNGTDLKEDLTSEIDSSYLENDSNVVEIIETALEVQLIEETAYSADSDNSVYSQSPNKCTGARSKLELANQSVLESCDTNTVTQSETENQVLKADNVNSNELLDQCGETEIITEKSDIDYCDTSDKSSELLIVNNSFHDESVSCSVDDTKDKCVKISVTETLSTSMENNSPVISSGKINNLHQRLPRPTTLDLPSRHAAVLPISSENNLNVSESSSIEPANSSDIMPNETLLDEVSEPSPSNQQQPRIGLVKPFWIPDADAPNCMHCGVKFTVIKRRHHCRACGKVLCSRCCNLKAKLAYLNKEDRICHPCFEILSSTSQSEDIPSSTADSQSSSSCGSSPNFSPSPQISNANFNDKNSWRPHPNNPDDYCSTIPPLQQIQLSGSRPPPTVMVPIGVLKRGNKPRREPKQVIFSDGIRPGGDLTDLTEPVDVIPAYRRMNRKRIEKAVLGDSVSSVVSPVPFSASQRSKQKRVLVSDDEGPLPPVVLQIDNDRSKEEKLDWNQLIEKMQDEDQKPVNFALLKNMHLFVKLSKLDCCYGKECWCFTSHGLCAVGQDEVMVILERTPGENILPRGIIKLFTHIYDSASKGSTFEDLGHVIFPEQILGSSDHRGFLFVRPTFQCLNKLVVPNTPFLVAILIHKWEVPWAKVFPLRLMLRLGAECRYYPCALVSVRQRKPVFFEIGQTIMSVLADLRNYQFTIPVIPGLVVHMEEKKTFVNIPRNRYEKVMKILNSNNVEHVLALGSNFSSEADSHLVCMQKEEGDYQTQAINIENTTRRVIGTSFIVFSGALKSSSGLSAKFSIVEDGLLVQIPQETMVALHMALRDMKDLTVECGQINAAEPEEIVIVQWTRDDKKFNIGVRSPIDGKSLEGIQSLRIHTSTDYAGDSYLIRWTEVFFLEVDESNNSIQHELVDPCRLAETIAQSCCMALAPYLDQLAESELTKIGLRVTLDSERDRVEYDIGARGKPLPAVYMNALDCGLIPVILRLSGSAQSEPVSFELIFYILIK